MYYINIFKYPGPIYSWQGQFTHETTFKLSLQGLRLFGVRINNVPLYLVIGKSLFTSTLLTLRVKCSVDATMTSR